MARVFNKNTDEIPRAAVYIGRGSPWGNPFPITKEHSRNYVCDRFEREILPTLDIESLRGKDLVCFCSPKRCHGDSIIRKLESSDLTGFI
jgi:hypothetical protein